jgi:hypothetical protein
MTFPYFDWNTLIRPSQRVLLGKLLGVLHALLGSIVFSCFYLRALLPECGTRNWCTSRPYDYIYSIPLVRALASCSGRPTESPASSQIEMCNYISSRSVDTHKLETTLPNTSGSMHPSFRVAHKPLISFVGKRRWPPGLYCTSFAVHVPTQHDLRATPSASTPCRATSTQGNVLQISREI